MTIPGREKVELQGDQTLIEGFVVTKHSEYLGWDIYRTTEKGPISPQFIAVRVMEKSGLVSIRAMNLEGIKRIIRREEGIE